MSCGRGLHYLVVMSNDLVCYLVTMNKHDWKTSDKEVWNKF